MKKNLKSKLIAVVGGGAFALATVMIQELEGEKFTPYRDVAGTLTVCYGHTGKDIIAGKKYNQFECNALLERDLRSVQKNVDILVKVALPDTTKAALYSFVYNVGIGNFSRSTLLKKINSKDPSACDEMKRWILAGGKVWQGLVNRREVEAEFCHVYRVEDL
ncbi:lysozyme [Orbaceae bacterium ESL0721]|nr:lysozyme [Orbaceae bacterium ESL0721]